MPRPTFVRSFLFLVESDALCYVRRVPETGTFMELLHIDPRAKENLWLRTTGEVSFSHPSDLLQSLPEQRVSDQSFRIADITQRVPW